MERRAAFLRRMRGRCFRCLSSKHHSASCRRPRVCWLCEKEGHLARDCKRQPEKPPLPRLRSTPVSQRLSFADALMAPVRGDLSGRPERDECYATAAEEVLALERRYDTRANLINIGLDRSLKDSVDGALQEENERVGELLLKVGQPLLTEHGEVEAGQEDEAAGSEEASTEELHLPLQSETAAAGEEAWNEPVSISGGASPINLWGHCYFF